MFFLVIYKKIYTLIIKDINYKEYIKIIFVKSHKFLYNMQLSPLICC